MRKGERGMKRDFEREHRRERERERERDGNNYVVERGGRHKDREREIV